MNYTMRRFLQDLFNAFNHHAEDLGDDVTFELKEDLMTGKVAFSSSVCAYTFLLNEMAAQAERVVDTHVFIIDDTDQSPEAIEAAFNEGVPAMKMPFTSIQFNDSSTFEALYLALTNRHAFRSAQHLLDFTQQQGNG